MITAATVYNHLAGAQNLGLDFERIDVAVGLLESSGRSCSSTAARLLLHSCLIQDSCRLHGPSHGAGKDNVMICHATAMTLGCENQSPSWQNNLRKCVQLFLEFIF